MGQIVAGTGLDKTGNTLDIDSTVVTLSETQTLTNKTLTTPKINENVDLTATATELNVLDGITASTAELNTLDGITATVAELNVLDGITSTVAELNILDGVTSTALELNILDGVTATTTELNYVDGVTSSIQTQLDGKASKTSSINGQSSAYTLALTDVDSIVEASGAITITIPADSTTNFAIGSSIDIVNIGSGIVTLAGAEGVSLLSKESNKKISTQYSAATLYKRASNTWVAIGDLSA